MLADLLNSFSKETKQHIRMALTGQSKTFEFTSEAVSIGYRSNKVQYSYHITHSEFFEWLGKAINHIINQA